MSDSYNLGFQNFRSIADATVEISPLTVVYGANGSGKSSLIYGLLTLKNFLNNPNQVTPSFFSYPSISLGGRQEVIHRHLVDKSIAFSIGTSSEEELSANFTLTLHESGGAVEISFDERSVRRDRRIAAWPNSLGMTIAVPYTANQQVDNPFALAHRRVSQMVQRGQDTPQIPGTVFWNGLILSARLNTDATAYSEVIGQLVERANLPLELARQTGFVPLRRGFSKPAYTFSNVTQALTNEDEVASLLAAPTERFGQYEISRYVERIANRRIQTQPQIGTSTFTIDSIPIGTGVPASIVNEGFGINQLVYMLTICLFSRFKIVAIEEPEIHLHPSMVRRLATALAEIAAEKGRRLIVSTHSEAFVVSLLSQISAGKISCKDVSFILAENQRGITTFAQQHATEKGQIEGGLRAFMASEAKDLVDFLGTSGG
ncbi:MAG: AAA family ATPase [Gemmatimonadota bacterium]|nr:AAA family ATPase [Gemmatimonadota bacterium]